MNGPSGVGVVFLEYLSWGPGDRIRVAPPDNQAMASLPGGAKSRHSWVLALL